MRKKGQLAIAVIMVFIVVIVLFVSAIVSPLGIAMTTSAYQSSEYMLELSNQTAQQIQNPTIKAYVEQTVTDANNSTQDNLDLFEAMFKYGWVVLVFVIGLTGFLWTRRAVETGGVV